MLEEAKSYVQEQLLRKAAQKEAIAAMDEEMKRSVFFSHVISGHSHQSVLIRGVWPQVYTPIYNWATLGPVKVS